MKRLLFTVLLLLFATFVYADVDTLEGMAIDDTTTIEGLAGASAIEGQTITTADDYSDILFWWNCESVDLTDSGNYSAGDTGATLNGDAVIAAAANKVGTKGLDLDDSSSNGGDNAQFVVGDVSSNDIVDDAQGAAAGWFKINTWQDDVSLWYAEDDGDNWIQVKLDLDDDITFIWKESGSYKSAPVTSAAGLTTGNWYFWVATWNVTTNTRTITVYNVSGTLIATDSDTTAIAGMAGDFVLMKVGNTLGNPGDVYIDGTYISNSASRDFHALRDTTDYPG